MGIGKPLVVHGMGQVIVVLDRLLPGSACSQEVILIFVAGGVIGGYNIFACIESGIESKIEIGNGLGLYSLGGINNKKSRWKARFLSRR